MQQNPMPATTVQSQPITVPRPPELSVDLPPSKAAKRSRSKSTKPAQSEIQEKATTKGMLVGEELADRNEGVQTITESCTLRGTSRISELSIDLPASEAAKRSRPKSTKPAWSEIQEKDTTPGMHQGTQHRQIPYHPNDVLLLMCRQTPYQSKVFINGIPVSPTYSNKVKYILYSLNIM